MQMDNPEATANTIINQLLLGSEALQEPLPILKIEEYNPNAKVVSDDGYDDHDNEDDSDSSDDLAAQQREE